MHISYIIHTCRQCKWNVHDISIYFHDIWVIGPVAVHLFEGLDFCCCSNTFVAKSLLAASLITRGTCDWCRNLPQDSTCIYKIPEVASFFKPAILLHLGAWTILSNLEPWSMRYQSCWEWNPLCWRIVCFGSSICISVIYQFSAFWTIPFSASCNTLYETSKRLVL